ncbi:hypothetical protein EYF80_065098 [Liparis tanakae]|uniref:Uncharacterized protein n=1 Tax=Liparis tanakae TaxID=230148 RepID=A0A4Z2E774_9TELE|nr:hypothetical protein EYF80_065098 [Liparis tanakae]
MWVINRGELCSLVLSRLIPAQVSRRSSVPSDMPADSRGNWANRSVQLSSNIPFAIVDDNDQRVGQ